MHATSATRQGPRYWLPLVVAISIAAFVAGFATDANLSRAAGHQGPAAREDAGSRSAGTAAMRVSDAIRGDSLSAAQWEAIYGPTAATWGVWRIAPHSLSGAQWEALYGPTAATWGVWKPLSGELTRAATPQLYGRVKAEVVERMIAAEEDPSSQR